MKIREYKPTDLDQVQILNEQLGYKTNKDTLKQRLEKIVKDQTRKFLIATDNNDHAIAWIHVWGMLQVEDEGRAQIAGLVVDEKHRNKGIGQNLIKKAEIWASENGYTSLYLSSRIQREAAHRFYKRLGFEIKKTSHGFFKKLP